VPGYDEPRSLRQPAGGIGEVAGHVASGDSARVTRARWRRQPIAGDPAERHRIGGHTSYGDGGLIARLAISLMRGVSGCGDRWIMPPDAVNGQRPMRALIIDDHEISRAAVSALLRTEGLDVADARAGEAAIAVAIAFRPAVAIVDVTPVDAAGFRIADRLRALPDAPAVVLTSSVDRRRFASRLDGYRFVAKADLCVQAI
jgi:CheY-like chemotaxis protein